MPSEACAEELETVLAIFLDDIQVEYETDSVLVTMVLFPSTGDDSESKYVTFTLELTLPPEYPEAKPGIKFRNPRGLSEDMLITLEAKMHQKCEEILGCSMIFELIDMGKEFLTSNNRPASECPICLLPFTEFDVFFRPSCFHHVHSYCLGKYLYSLSQSNANEDNLPLETQVKNCCPVCRNEFVEDIDVQKLLSAPPPSEENQEALSSTVVPEDWLGKRESLNVLFAKQKSQGGIIDLNAKDKKALVISSPATRSESFEHGSSVSGASRSGAGSPPAQLSDVSGSGSSSSNETRSFTRGVQQSKSQNHYRNHNHRKHQHHGNHNQQSQPRQAPTASSNPAPVGVSNSTSETKTVNHSKDSNSCPHYRHRRRK